MDSKIIESVCLAAKQADLEVKQSDGKFVFRYQTFNYAFGSKIIKEVAVECDSVLELRKKVFEAYDSFDVYAEADKYLLEDDPDYDYLVQYMEDAKKAVYKFYESILQL